MRETSTNHIPFLLQLDLIKDSPNQLIVTKVDSMKYNKKLNIAKTKEQILLDHEGELKIGDQYTCINTPEKGIQSVGNKRKKGLKLVRESDWHCLKSKGNFNRGGLKKEMIKAIDFHINKIKKNASNPRTPVRNGVK